MAKNKPLRFRLAINVNGKTIPWLSEDEDGSIMRHLPPEQEQEYTQRILANVAEEVGRIVATNPDSGIIR